ncbi:unnamed protein product [Blepharisma stoltei]|uniref:Uncharacterized protein n=1 Tax=Blepharisma stoltei TaxID=1481888 RepID=A0AAU9J353_9CILI|nr:unnamed protein product [Blepharisma stoltei]
MKQVLTDEAKAAVCYEVSEIKAQYFVETASCVTKAVMIEARIEKMASQLQTLQAVRVGNIAAEPVIKLWVMREYW